MESAARTALLGQREGEARSDGEKMLVAKAGADYTGIDLTEAAIELARKRFALSQLNGEFRVSDAENLDFDDASFDLVYSHGVLHHTPDIEAAVREIYRVLKPGGRAIVMLYHRGSYNYRVGIRVLRRGAPPVPVETVESVKEDVAWVKTRAKSGSA